MRLLFSTWPILLIDVVLLFRLQGRCSEKQDRYPVARVQLREPPDKNFPCATVLLGSKALPFHLVTLSALAVKTLRNCSMLRTPKETYDYTVKLAEHKGHYGIFRQFVLALAAGTYVGIGVTVIMLVGGGLSPELRAKEPGLFLFLYSTFGFPTALTLIVLTGTDLFTSTVAYMAFGLMEKRVAPVNALRSVALSWVANFLGALFIMGIMAGAQVFNGRDMYLVYAAERKVLHYGWGTLIAKGVLCNWFVNLAVWQANAANDLISKFIGILLPISAFVVTNGEHCVANMFLLSIAKHHHAEYTISQMFHRNLVPVTIGNILGGVIMISLTFFLAYGSLGESIQEFEIDHVWKRLEAHDHRHEPLNVVTIAVHPDPPAGV